jgi:hypothetical protein
VRAGVAIVFAVVRFELVVRVVMVSVALADHSKHRANYVKQYYTLLDVILCGPHPGPMADTKRRAPAKKAGAGGRGRPPKAEGGLGGVLFIRATQDTLEALDALATAWSAETGLTVTRSDVARKLLAEALEARTRGGGTS